jgi:hypothetical protein
MRSNESLIDVRGWTFRLPNGRNAISPIKPSPERFPQDLPRHSLKLDISGLPAHTFVEARGRLCGVRLTVDSWHCVEPSDGMEFLRSSRILQESAAAHLAKIGTQAAHRSDEEIESFIADLEKLWQVTFVSKVEVDDTLVAVVTALEPADVVTFVQDSGFQRHVFVRRARWSEEDIKAAESLIGAVPEDDIVSASGGITANGDYAVVLTVYARNEILARELSNLPPGLVTVTEWIPRVPPIG